MAAAAAGNRLQYSGGLAYVNVLRGVDGDDPFRNTSAQGRIAYHLSGSTVVRARLFAADAFAKLNSSPLQAAVLPASGIITAVPLATFFPGPNDPPSPRPGRFFCGAFERGGQPPGKLAFSASV